MSKFVTEFVIWLAFDENDQIGRYISCPKRVLRYLIEWRGDKSLLGRNEWLTGTDGCPNMSRPNQTTLSTGVEKAKILIYANTNTNMTSPNHTTLWTLTVGKGQNTWYAGFKLKFFFNSFDAPSTISFTLIKQLNSQNLIISTVDCRCSKHTSVQRSNPTQSIGSTYSTKMRHPSQTA